MITIARLIYLQALWYLFILYGQSQYAILFPVIALAITAVDKHLFEKEISWKKFFNFTLFLLCCGLIIDSTLLIFKFMIFKGWDGLYSPYFMWAIWIIFFPYYAIAFEKFHNKKIITAIAGLIFAPISYLGGTRIGSLEIIDTHNVIFIGLMWAIFFPTSVQLYFQSKRQ